MALCVKQGVAVTSKVLQAAALEREKRLQGTATEDCSSSVVNDELVTVKCPLDTISLEDF